MSRRPCTFRQPDVVRLLKAANAAGCVVDRIEIFDRFGNKIVAVIGRGYNTVHLDASQNEWDVPVGEARQ
jgi:hypothetical protein